MPSAAALAASSFGLRGLPDGFEEEAELSELAVRDVKRLFGIDAVQDAIFIVDAGGLDAPVQRSILRFHACLLSKFPMSSS